MTEILTQKTIDAIVAKAASSDLAHRSWSQRGRAPIGYTKGMAVCYGRTYAKLKAGDAIAKAMVVVVEGHHDVFDYYESEFGAAGMPNSGVSDADRLRHLFVLMFNLGLWESSGGSDIGQDSSAPGNRTSDEAEAGLFQQSWNSRSANPSVMQKLFDFYSTNRPEFDYGHLFGEGVTVRPGSFTNYGSGDGLEFQQICKTRPEAAVEFAAVGLRTLCNAWGPINTRHVELGVEADTLFKQVQEIVDIQIPSSTSIGKPSTPAASKGWLSILIDAIVRMFSRPREHLPVPANPPLTPPVNPDPASHTPWMPVAIKEVGFHERGENLGIEKYVIGGKTGGSTGEPWCADFANYCIETSGIPGTHSAMARSFSHHPNFVKLDGPAFGAVTVLWRGSPSGQSGHVFFYAGEHPSRGIWGLGGNQSDSVCYQWNPRSRLLGYYWPKSVALPKIGKIPVSDNGQGEEGSET